MSLTLAENRRVYYLFENLKLFESVAKALQKYVTLPSDVRAIFDAGTSENPSLSGGLSANASIVLFKLFESTVVQVQSENDVALSWDERQQIEHFEHETANESDNDNANLSFVERALKRQKTEH